MIRVTCQHCRARFEASDEKIGLEASCPKCNSRILIERPDPLLFWANVAFGAFIVLAVLQAIASVVLSILIIKMPSAAVPAQMREEFAIGVAVSGIIGAIYTMGFGFVIVLLRRIADLLGRERE